MAQPKDETKLDYLASLHADPAYDVTSITDLTAFLAPVILHVPGNKVIEITRLLEEAVIPYDVMVTDLQGFVCKICSPTFTKYTFILFSFIIEFTISVRFFQ